MSPSERRPTPLASARSLGTALRLRCPRCGRGRLFTGWFTMAPGCDTCALSFRREPGFYLGSIYINYGVTALATIALYGLLVLGCGLSAEQALGVCLAVAVLLPVWLFRYARAFLLAIDTSVNRETEAPGADGTLSEAQLSSYKANDGQAGCAMGIAMTLVLLFGLVMAGVTLWFAIGPGAGDWAGDALDAPAPMERGGAAE